MATKTKEFSSGLECVRMAARVLARCPGTPVDRLQEAYTEALKAMPLSEVPQAHRENVAAIIETLSCLTGSGVERTAAMKIIQGDRGMMMIDKIFDLYEEMLIAKAAPSDAKAKAQPFSSKMSVM